MSLIRVFAWQCTASSPDPAPMIGYVGSGPNEYRGGLFVHAGRYCYRWVVSADLWNDGNHRSPGIGWVGLLCVLSSAVKTDTNAIVGGAPGTGIPYILMGGKFCVDVAAPAAGGGLRLGKNTVLAPWLQTRSARADEGRGRYVNLGGRDTIDAALGFTLPFERPAQQTIACDAWKHIEMRFSADEHELLHYGSSTIKQDIYEADADHVPDSLDSLLMEPWAWNIGIHARYGQTEPTSAEKPYGWLVFDGFELWVDAVLNPNATAV